MVAPNFAQSSIGSIDFPMPKKTHTVLACTFSGEKNCLTGKRESSQKTRRGGAATAWVCAKERVGQPPSRTAFRSESEQQSERSEADIVMVEQVFGIVKRDGPKRSGGEFNLGLKLEFGDPLRGSFGAGCAREGAAALP